MFSEDIDFFNSHARYQMKSEIDEKKNIKNLIDQTKDLIKSLKNEKLSDDIKIKVDNISSVLKLI